MTALIKNMKWVDNLQWDVELHIYYWIASQVCARYLTMFFFTLKLVCILKNSEVQARVWPTILCLKGQGILAITYYYELKSNAHLSMLAQNTVVRVTMYRHDTEARAET